MGVEHELKVFLPAPPGIICQFDFTRGPGRDFDERDRAILVLLRPHLARLRHRWAQSIHSDYLTAREHEIIRLVARGLTNREIAEKLVVSTNTVRSHLDHIYEKLGVHTRTAAVAAATSKTNRRLINAAPSRTKLQRQASMTARLGRDPRFVSTYSGLATSPRVSPAAPLSDNFPAVSSASGKIAAEVGHVLPREHLGYRPV